MNALYIIGGILILAMSVRVVYLIGRVHGFNDCWRQVTEGDIKIDRKR